MISSVSVEAERELIDGALYYARDAGPDLGFPFIAEFERCLTVLCAHPLLGAVWRGRTRRFPLRRFPYSILYLLVPEKVESSRLRTKVGSLAIGNVEGNGHRSPVEQLRPNPALERTRRSALFFLCGRGWRRAAQL